MCQDLDADSFIAYFELCLEIYADPGGGREYLQEGGREAREIHREGGGAAGQDERAGGVQDEERGRLLVKGRKEEGSAASGTT